MDIDHPVEAAVHQALVQATAALAQQQVAYALIGGLATSYRSQPRFTKDVDFLLAIPQLVLPALLEDLERRGFQFEMAATMRAWTQHHMAVLTFHGVRVDLLKSVIPAYTHVLDHATDERWFDQPMRIASVEGLILLKLLAFRTQDQLDIENLVDANRTGIGLDWLRTEWQTVAALDDSRWQYFLKVLGASG
jgi:hypothetical protein